MSAFRTAARRLERDILAKRAKIEDWEYRLRVGMGDPSSLRAHITRARRDIEGKQLQIRALERGKR